MQYFIKNASQLRFIHTQISLIVFVANFFVFQQFNSINFSQLITSNIQKQIITMYIQSTHFPNYQALLYKKRINQNWRKNGVRVDRSETPKIPEERYENSSIFKVPSVKSQARTYIQQCCKMIQLQTQHIFCASENIMQIIIRKLLIIDNQNQQQKERIKLNRKFEILSKMFRGYKKYFKKLPYWNENVEVVYLIFFCFFFFFFFFLYNVNQDIKTANLKIKC
eukprot:TRINITY_DN12537_c0_g1_i1.p1 TRINITY_DN12537_c0_g1~~TRINITY_DN12537_c0_g1_i1.p1  ORF type:complete len:223 (+),score=3.21 TRINITY_DN12537_c0_g1_i1:89-757(+)